MPIYKHEVQPNVWGALKTKAALEQTTPEALLDRVVTEFCTVCFSQACQERRNAIISRIVDLPADKIEELERAVAKIADATKDTQPIERP